MGNETGVFYGIGVGPGDPELLPIKAVKILKQVDVVFAAASSEKSRSLALNAARPYIPSATPINLLPFPMSKDPAKVQEAWKQNAAAIIRDLTQGRNAAFLTLGDSMTYSTYSYILKYLRLMAPDISVNTIPGVTSFQASAARLNIPLVEGDESLLVLSGVNGIQRYRQLADRVENIVFLKVYRNIEEIITALEQTGRIASSTALQNCSLPEEAVVHDIRLLRERPADYWTLIIVKKKNEEKA